MFLALIRKIDFQRLNLGTHYVKNVIIQNLNLAFAYKFTLYNKNIPMPPADIRY